MAKKAAPKKRIIKGRDYNTDKRSDGLRQAKRKGWRITNSNKIPTKKEIQDFYDGKRHDLYMENRVERSDFSTRAKKGERFEKGGSIDSSMRFTGNDYDKLIDSGKFEGVKNGNLYELKEIDSSKVLGKFNESKETLFISGKKDLSNPLVVWLKENSYMSSDNVDKLAEGGKVGQKKFSENYNVGKSKYVINYHDGVKTHKDGSEFYDIEIFKNKKDLEAFKSKLLKEGYVSKYEKGGEVNDSDIKELSNGYKEAILFTGYDEDEVELDANYSISDFDSKANEAIEKMAKQYIVDNKDAIKESGLDYGTIGRDIWYAQAGHGVGFFDEELDKEVEDKLTKGAKKFGDLSHNVFAQDGKVYLEGMKFAKGGKIDRTKSNKKTRVNRTKKAIAQDKNIKALHGGKRISESGSVYYEYRENRQDSNRTKKLEKGGSVQHKNWLKGINDLRLTELKSEREKIEKEYADDYVEVGGSGRNKAQILADFDEAISEREKKEFANGGKVGKNKLTYKIVEIPAYNSKDEEVGKWYRIYDSKGRLKTLFTRNWLNSDKKHSVTEVGNKELAEKILDEINSGKHNEDKIVGREADYDNGIISDKKDYSVDIDEIKFSKGGLIKGTDIEKIKSDKDKIFEKWDIARLKNKKENYHKTGQSVTESLKRGWAFSENSSRKLVDWINENIFEKQSDEAYHALFYMANSNQSTSSFVEHWDNLDSKYKEMLPEMWVSFLESHYLSSKLDMYRNKIEELEDGKFAKGGKVKLREIEDETVLMPYVIAEPIAETAAEITLKDEFSKWESLSKSEKEALDEKYKNLVDEISVYLVKRANTVYTHNKSFEKDVKGKKGREVLNTFMEHWCGLVDGKLVKPISDTMARYEKESKSASFEDGGEVSFENKYEGHSAEEVWNGWNESQRSHFLLDHSELLDNDRTENNLGHSRTIQKDKNYSALTPHTKRVLESHVEKGQYKKGGEIVKFEKLKFNSHKNHNPKTDILEGHIDGDSFITYGIDVNGDKKGTEHMEYYKGSNFVVGSKKPSSSRHYTKEAIPTKWKASWEELKKEYEEKYSKEEFEKGGDLGSYVSEDKKFNDYKKTLEEKYGKGFSNKSLSEEEFEKLYELKERRSNSYEKNIPIEDARNPKMEKGGEIKSELTLSEIENKLGKTFGFWDVPYEVKVDGTTYRKAFMGKTYRKI